MREMARIRWRPASFAILIQRCTSNQATRFHSSPLIAPVCLSSSLSSLLTRLLALGLPDLRRDSHFLTHNSTLSRLYRADEWRGTTDGLFCRRRYSLARPRACASHIPPRAHQFISSSVVTLHAFVFRPPFRGCPNLPSQPVPRTDRSENSAATMPFTQPRAV
jgi:hypothetical protein